MSETGKRKKREAEERAERARQEFSARIEKRTAEEHENGTIFFSGPIETARPELKLRGDRLTFLRPESGEYANTQGYLLKRLEWDRWQEGRLKLHGEFYYQSSDPLYHVHEKDARIIRTTLTVRRPLENEAVLAEFLEKERIRAASIAPTPVWEMVSGMLKSFFLPVAAVCMALYFVPGILLRSLFQEETGGTLEGFERIGGMHYPVYSFSLPDGSVCRKMDMEVSLEDSAAQEEVEKILLRKYPRKVKVRYSRRNPEKSRCIYL